jgi:hypothetical protein
VDWFGASDVSARGVAARACAAIIISLNVYMKVTHGIKMAATGRGGGGAACCGSVAGWRGTGARGALGGVWLHNGCGKMRGRLLTR